MGDEQVGRKGTLSIFIFSRHPPQSLPFSHLTLSDRDLCATAEGNQASTSLPPPASSRGLTSHTMPGVIETKHDLKERNLTATRLFQAAFTNFVRVCCMTLAPVQGTFSRRCNQ